MKTKKEKDIYAGPARFLIDFLTKEITINRRNINDYERPIKLVKMVEIYDSNLSMYSKVYNMNSVYTPVQFSNTIKVYNKFKEDPILGGFVSKLQEIDSFYKKSLDDGTLTEVNSLMKMENYFKSYEYASFIISSYVNYDNSPYLSKFLEEYGLDSGIFDYCLKVVAEFDPDLYKEYVKKSLENRVNRISKNTANLGNIANGVKTGYTLDGKVFDIIEFLKRIPFWDLESSREVLDDFGVRKGSEFSLRIRALIKQVMPEYYHEILKYLNENNIDTYYFQPLREKDVYGIKLTVNGREVTKEDKDIIMNYIKENDLPMVVKSYEVVRNKYLDGEITKDSVKSETYEAPKKYTLVP